MTGPVLRALAALALLAACTGSPAPPGLALLRPAPPPPSARVLAAFAAQAPALLVTIEGRDASDAFVAVARREGVTTWESARGVTLATRDGILLATRGLGGDLASADPSASAGLILAARSGPADRFMGVWDGEGHVALRSYACDVAPRGLRRIAVAGGGTLEALLVAETCSNPTQAFENLYWLDPATHALLQSRQWAGDTTGPLALFAAHSPDGPR